MLLPLAGAAFCGMGLHEGFALSVAGAGLVVCKLRQLAEHRRVRLARHRASEALDCGVRFE